MTWKWLSITDAVNGPRDVANPDRYTFQLRPSGVLVVQADCNRGGGQFRQLGLETVEHLAEGLAIGEADIAPHDGVAGGNAGEVTKAAGGIAENLVVLTQARQAINQAVGQKVRQVAGGGQHLIMVIDRHLCHLGAAGLPHGLDLGGGRRVCPRQGGEDDAPVAVEFGEGGIDPALFRAGDGVAGDETRGQPTKDLAGILHHAALDAATIGQNGARGQMIADSGEGCGHSPQGYGDEDQIGAGHRPGRVLVVAVDHPQLDGPLQIAQRAPAANHLAHEASPAQGPGQGAPDEADADNRELLDHADKAAARAASRRAFSAS